MLAGRPFFRTEFGKIKISSHTTPWFIGIIIEGALIFSKNITSGLNNV